jgi:hypothetical protein
VQRNVTFDIAACDSTLLIKVSRYETRSEGYHWFLLEAAKYSPAAPTLSNNMKNPFIAGYLTANT